MRKLKIYLALGVSIGTEDSRELNLEVRYHKIVLLMDADIDGSHMLHCC